MSATRSFRRSIDALDDLFAFTEEVFAAEGIDANLRPPVDLALEELFTNVVRHGGKALSGVEVRLAKVEGGVEVEMTEPDADRFDPTDAPDFDVDAPLEERRAGGMGIHLVRKLVDFLEYRYSEERRQGRTTFRKLSPPHGKAKGDAGD